MAAETRGAKAEGTESLCSARVELRIGRLAAPEDSNQRDQDVES